MENKCGGDVDSPLRIVNSPVYYVIELFGGGYWEPRVKYTDYSDAYQLYRSLRIWHPEMKLRLVEVNSWKVLEYNKGRLLCLY